MVNKFPQYIDTDFVLITQADGFIINPHKWTDIFLEYDYIGAPFPDEPQYGFTGDTRVGNGGFSLRSKKLIDMPINLNLPYRNKEVDRWHEDNYYCVSQRKTLQEKYGVDCVFKSNIIKEKIKDINQEKNETMVRHGKCPKLYPSRIVHFQILPESA